MRSGTTSLFLIAVCAACAADAPTFDVASIRKSDPNARNGIIRPMPGNKVYMGRNVPLKLMMTVAYTVTDRQIAGGPDWINTERFDLDAKVEQPYPTEVLRQMLQRLLEERFQLKIRREKRELPVWALVVDKSGHKLTPHDPNDIDHPPIGPGPNGRGIAGKNVPMDYFAFMLSRLLDRNVVNRTDLAGNYDLTLDFVREAPPNAPDGAAPPQDGPSIFRALREQLGLRLDQSRGLVDFLVIEKAERPTAN